jgi:tetratricopeptide (TPR) repeat protein
MTNPLAQSTATVGEALGNARRLTATNPQAAIRQAREIIRVEPSIAEAYFILAAALRLSGDAEGASDAERCGLNVSRSDPVLVRVGEYLTDSQLANAERLLQLFLNDTPHDPEALRLSARLAKQRGKLEQAQLLLRRSLHLAPTFSEASDDLLVLFKAQEQALTAPWSAPEEPPIGTDEFDDALRRNERLVADNPDNPDNWVSYGHVLRISGRSRESLDAYRRSVQLKPTYGDGWWALADLKTFKFNPEDVDTMLQAIDSGAASKPDLIQIHFSLGKAFRDQGDFASSFRHYQSANKLKRGLLVYSADGVDDHVSKCEVLFTEEFFAARNGAGFASKEPIFIIGMPRAGSTLVEQILSSHSQIEGTEELFDLILLSEFLAGGHNAGVESPPYLDRLEGLAPDEFSALGASFIYTSRSKRQSKRPHFTDKMPSNWLHVGLIQLILPNAYIVDVRRDPVSCCFSNFRQNYASGKNFAYDLEELGRYYSAYVRLMAHFDKVLPGRVHRVHYERLTANPEEEVRSLLAYLNLPFEEACLRQHENPRAVKTSSFEQVRQPIYADSGEEVRPYEPWLGSLRGALGDVADAYPDVPERWKHG